MTEIFAMPFKSLFSFYSITGKLNMHAMNFEVDSSY